MLDLLHVDVMDAHFVPNLTIGPPVVAAIKRVAKKPLDRHLMMTDPQRYVADFAQGGSRFHYDSCRGQCAHRRNA